MTEVGIVFACYFAAGAAVTLAGGVWADRLPRRAVMIAADLIRLGTQTATAVLLIGGTMHVWELAVLQSIAGACGGFFNPASTALVPQTVSAGTSPAGERAPRAVAKRDAWCSGRRCRE